MPDVEFVREPDDDEHDDHLPRASRPRPARGLSRRFVLVGVLVVVVVVAIAAITSQGGGKRPAAASTHSPLPTFASPSPSPSPSSSVSTLALPEQLAFGPQTESVLAVGDRIYGLTAKLVGAVQRDGGELVVRPTPLALATAGRPALFIDEGYAILWTVAIGGTSIGSYDTKDLATRDDQVAPQPIRAAAAYHDELWFITDDGLFEIAPGFSAAWKVQAARGLRALAADPTRHRMLVLGSRGVTAYPVNGGPPATAPLPFAVGDDITVAGGRIWVAGHYDVSGVVSALDPRTLDVVGRPVATGSTGAPDILLTYRNRFLVTGVGAARTMACLNASTGAVLQTWPYRRGAAVALNDRGLLVSQGNGIELQSARDCLVGAS